MQQFFKYTNKFSTGALVTSGLSLLVVLVALIALFSFRGFTTMNDAFGRTSIAVDSTFALNTDLENLLDARIAIGQYRATGDQENLSRVEESITEILSSNSIGAIAGTDTALDTISSEIKASLVEYQDAFFTWRSLNDTAEAQFEQIDTIGPRARQTLSDLRTSASQADNIGAAYRASVVQEKLMLGRYYALLYFMRGEAPSAEKSIEYFGEAISQGQILTMTAGDPELREQVDQFMSDITQLLSIVKDLVASQEARTQFEDEQFNRLGDAVQTQTETALQSIRQNSQAVTDSTNTLFREISTSLPVLVGTALFIAAISAWLILAAIRHRFDRLVKTTEALANGDIDTTIANTEFAHEIGRMSRALEVFRDGELDRRTQAQREKLRMDRTAQTVLLISTALEQLAQGDLTARLSEDVSGEFEELRANFNRSMAELENTLSIVVASSSEIDSAMSGLAEASESLASRTEQQAGALAEVTTTVSEIETQLEGTASESKDAMVLVQSASLQADRGMNVMAQSVEAMAKIKKSSEEVVRIIGVIDDIAFQTNLLALNAGVESARAGEAGRGFAVVANEVQALAQRTGDAAQEIKGLIETSASEVSEGARLADDTSGALQEISKTVGAVNNAVEEISTTAQEQTVRVREISKVMSELDSLTQHNAAMVEETTAETMQLRQDVGRMRGVAGVFQVGELQQGTDAKRPNTGTVKAVMTEPSLSLAG